MNRISQLIILLPYFASSITANFTLPDGYVKCNISRSDFNKCAVSSFDKLVTSGITGIPDLNLPPLDPIFISRAYFKPPPNSPITLMLELKNLTFTGFSRLKIISVRGTNVAENIIRMEGFLPDTKVVANYTMTGRILRLPISGDGNCVINMKNMTISYKTTHSPTIRNGRTYLTIKNLTMNTDIKGGKVFYKSASKHNILGLSDHDINQSLNQNFLALYEEYKPMINKLMEDVVSPSVIKFNDQIAFEDLFLK